MSEECPSTSGKHDFYVVIDEYAKLTPEGGMKCVGKATVSHTCKHCGYTKVIRTIDHGGEVDTNE